ncbi:MAG: serine/threonine-protein kinase [Gemmataceae bacterium]
MNGGSDHTSARFRREPLLDEFELALQRGEAPRIESFLMRTPDSDREHLFRDLFTCEVEYRRRRGDTVSADEYLARFPEFSTIIDESLSRTAAYPKPKPPDAASLNPGDVVAGRYLILAALGKGGMGQVFQAQDTQLRQTVALKFLFKDRAADAEWIERLKQEVTLAQRVSHDNVCRVHHYQESDQGSFLVMEYAATGSLDSHLKKTASGRILPEDANALGRQLCDGLEAVHKERLFHCDLKPGNILLDQKGRVKLADFGLAVMAERMRPEDARQGTRQYMAPELLDGHPPSIRSDIYALGAVLYEMITGRRPFAGKSEIEIRNLQRSPPAPPSSLVPNLDRAFDRAIMPCLESDPGKRPSSTQEVKEKLPPLSRRHAEEEGGEGKIRLRTGLALTAVAIIGFLVNAAIADRTMAYRQLPHMKPTAWLQVEAASMASEIGGSRTPGPARHWGHEWDLDRIRYAADGHPELWRWTPDALSPLIYFWFRAGPEYHAPMNRPAPTDPPLILDGMVCVMLDPEGRLIEYHAVPPRQSALEPVQNVEERRTRWENKVLPFSGLSRDSFQRRVPSNRPPVFADDAWALQEIGGAKTVEFALCANGPKEPEQLVYYRVGEPLADGIRRDRAQGENVDGQSRRKMAGELGNIVILIAVLAAAPLAWRNWRLGRADVTGNLRVVGLYAVTNLVGWLFITDHLPSLQVERVMLMNMCGMTVVWGVVLLVCCLSIEPYMRQRWPERLSSWLRLLSGGYRNPLVGRDVLYGLISGVVVAAVIKSAAWAGGTYYLVAPVYDPMTPNVPPGLAISLVAYSVVRTAGTFVVLLLLGAALRREWLAWVVLTLVIMVIGVQPLVSMSRNSPFTWAGSLGVAVVLVFTAVWFGWVASLVGYFTASVLNIIPLTFSPDPWYSGVNAFAATLLVALTAYGVRVSTGGGKPLRGGAAADT